MNKTRVFYAGIIIFAMIEIFISCVTLVAVAGSLLMGKSTKPPEVLVFVLTSAAISFGLGIGLFRRSRSSYHLILFFSTVIILSKVLIFAKIIYLSGALETAIPSSTKNIISIIYHGLLILYFVQPAVREQFKEKRSVLSFIKSPFCKC